MHCVLLLVSHGQMAQATLDSACMIAGKIPEAYTICMNPEDSAEDVKKKVKEVLYKVKGSKLIVMADLLGGTPCNSTIVELYGREDSRLICGFNLGMVLEYAMSQFDDIDELKDYLIEVGKDNIRDVFKEMSNMPDD